MTRWPQPWRVIGRLLLVLTVASWLAAIFTFLFVGVGPPRREIGFIAAGGFGLLAVLLFALFIGIAIYLGRTRQVPRVPLDPEQKLAIRRSFKWVWISYAPLIAGLAWMLFAINQWPGFRGVLLGASGLIIGLAGSSAAFLPFLLAISPARRIMGMSLVTYTRGSIIVGVALAVITAVAAFALPLR
jgi:hypothetical protein